MTDRGYGVMRLGGSGEPIGSRQHAFIERDALRYFTATDLVDALSYRKSTLTVSQIGQQRLFRSDWRNLQPLDLRESIGLGIEAEKMVTPKKLRRDDVEDGGYLSTSSAGKPKERLFLSSETPVFRNFPTISELLIKFQNFPFCYHRVVPLRNVLKWQMARS